MVSEGKIRQLFAYVKFPRKIFLILQRATLWQFSVICDLFVILSPWSSHRDDGKKWQKLWATRKVFSTLGDVSSQDMEQLYGKKTNRKINERKTGTSVLNFLTFMRKIYFFYPTSIFLRLIWEGFFYFFSNGKWAQVDFLEFPRQSHHPFHIKNYHPGIALLGNICSS